MGPQPPTVCQYPYPSLLLQPDGATRLAAIWDRKKGRDFARCTTGKPSDFRPISLCTFLYKVCANILAARLEPVLHKLISWEQAASLCVGEGDRFRITSCLPRRLITRYWLQDPEASKGRRHSTSCTGLSSAELCILSAFLRDGFPGFLFPSPPLRSSSMAP